VKEGEVLAVRDLKKVFHVKKGFLNPVKLAIRAVDGVSFTLMKGEALGIVGESGCGKSTVGRCILQLIEPTAGSVTFHGEEIVGAGPKRLRVLRRQLQIIFQDPYSSLNPRRSIGKMLMEPLLVHGICDRNEARERVNGALSEVGLPEDAWYKYAHEFSGGQRQRIAIARALILDPEVIIADEAVSALDVSIQAQILLLLKNLKEKHDLSFMFISHDLGVVRYFCQRIAVMYLGRIIEIGPVPDIFDDPLHPYTRDLRDASPVPDPANKVVFRKLEGEVPSPASPPKGCHFHPRCAKSMDVCKTVTPHWIDAGNGRGVACHLYNDDRRVPR
jgi:oligopeptide/dipeptide ABC transporter ATP-binding protein